MKNLLIIPAAILLAGCAAEPEPITTCGLLSSATKTLYTKEGFPIVDDQAAIITPCSRPVISVSTTTPTPPSVEPPIIVPPVVPPTEPSAQKPKCNAGRGNNSEGTPDCDPGKSGGVNKGGD